MRYNDANAPLLLTDLDRLHGVTAPSGTLRTSGRRKMLARLLACRHSRLSHIGRGRAPRTSTWPGAAVDGTQQALQLEFTLAPSHYATMLIRELTKMDTSVGAQAARTVQ